ncbi:MAG: hypothetical protein J5666_06960 [Bacilli bacterium]|nr:hypothetical protein [Bacilli bacterium]
MNWNFLVTFAIGVGVYLLGLFVWAMFKRHRNKKKFQKELKQDEESKEQQDSNLDSQE